MKSLRTVRYSLLAAAVAGGAMISAPAAAGVSATAGVANLYLWRGKNLGGGTPVVMGSLDYGHDSGLFAGVWSSSGDSTLGSEIDLYAGYAYSSDAFGFKVTAYDYTYPRSGNTGDLQEVVLTVSASGFFADAIIGVGDFEDGNYYDAGYTMGKFTGKFGLMDTEDVTADTNYSHFDLTYAYNERLAFTVSGIVDADDAAAVVDDKDPLFVVAYTLPLELK
ncbi:MAG: TorF family putative porin [Pseudomonadota bacterium]